jgi:hypothetical protein
MFERVRCGVCEVTRQRKAMSVFEGICDDCFRQHYLLCNECGRLLRNRTSNVNRPPIAPLNWETICYECWHIRQGRSTSWSPTPLDLSFATYQRIGSKRKFGVEIETDYCGGFEELVGKTKFGCKNDGSISGKEFPSPILYGDEGLAEIEQFLAIAAEKNWSANIDCGCHTHYDMRDESEAELYSIAYAYAKTYRPFWQYCVSVRRRNNGYCRAPRYTAYDVRARRSGCYDDSGDWSYRPANQFRDFCRSLDRCDYVNLAAYGVHKTFEVRLLEGTIDAETVCNWVITHARFMDYVKKLNFDELDHFFSGDTRSVLAAIAGILEDAQLLIWLTARLDRQG